jgi:PPM family protein phosphatase
MSSWQIEWAALSDTGRQRDHNEDSFLADDTEGLWVVADGMGGHQSGEEASQIAVACIHQYLVDFRDDPQMRARFAQAGIQSRPLQDLASAIRYANERIFIEAMKDPSKEGMGTTVVACLRVEDAFVLGHVGDSRIYRLRNNALEQISLDHSLLNHLLATGQLSPDKVSGFSQTNVILKAMGLRDQVDADVTMQPFRDGDIYLLCSDGLSDLVDDSTIGQVMLAARDHLSLGCQKLVELANAAGGKDNITVCMIKVFQFDQPMVVL